MILHTGNVKPSETSFFWSPAMSARFWPVAILFYLCALAAGLTYVVNDECGFAFFPGRADLFVGVILLLIGFEVWAYRRYEATMTRRVGIGLLVARMVLIEAAMSVDCSGFSAFLYIFIPFRAYFFLNRWASLALAGLYFGWFSINFTLFRCIGCDFDEYVTQILLFGLAILWSVALAPDIILMDIRMPVMDGIAATQQIRGQWPACQVIMLTTFDDDDFIIKSLQAGACGYLLKDIPAKDLAQAVQLAHAGIYQLAPEIAGKLIGNFEDIGSRPKLDVLRLIVTGATNREIAKQLFVSEGTVKNHVSNILSRLGLHDRTQAAVYALEHNLI